MNSVVVVEAKVGVELKPQAAQPGVHVAREGGPPTLVENRLVQRLDVAVCLRAPGADAGVVHLQPVDCLGEIPLELVPVVREETLQAPARLPQVLGDAAGELGGLFAFGLAGLPVLQITSSAQA